MRQVARFLAMLPLVIGCRTETPFAPRPNFRSEGSNHLLLSIKEASNGTSLLQGSPWTTSWTPSAWTFCLLYAPTFDVIDYSGATPLPEAVQATAVVGCNTALPGARQVFDFDAQNTPGWAAFANSITNGVDEMLWQANFLVDPNAIPYFLGGGGASESCTTCWEKTGYALSGTVSAPDLSGFQIDRVRLVVHNSEWSTSPTPPDPGLPYYLNFSYDLVWEIYGEKAH